MKNTFMLAVSAGVLALTALSANASIIVGVITTMPDGSGGTLWTYPITFNNSAIDSTQPTSFNINDFGGLKAPPTFTGPGPTFTITTPLVGPNFGLPGFQANNPSVNDVVLTFTSSANLGGGIVSFTMTLDTSVTGPGGLANFFSQDRVATGDLAGSPNTVQQNIMTPMGVPTGTVPDGGVTAILFGTALSGLGLLRRKLS